MAPAGPTPAGVIDTREGFMPEALLALLGVVLLVLAALVPALGAPSARTPLVILGAASLALAFDWHTIAAGFGH